VLDCPSAPRTRTPPRRLDDRQRPNGANSFCCCGDSSALCNATTTLSTSAITNQHLLVTPLLTRVFVIVVAKNPLLRVCMRHVLVQRGAISTVGFICLKIVSAVFLKGSLLYPLYIYLLCACVPRARQWPVTLTFFVSCFWRLDAVKYMFDIPVGLVGF
jgi:hypothetical protein